MLIIFETKSLVCFITSFHHFIVRSNYKQRLRRQRFEIVFIFNLRAVLGQVDFTVFDLFKQNVHYFFHWKSKSYSQKYLDLVGSLLPQHFQRARSHAEFLAAIFCCDLIAFHFEETKHITQHLDGVRVQTTSKIELKNYTLLIWYCVRTSIHSYKSYGNLYGCLD